MPINPKTITVFLDASPSGQRRAARAAALARSWDAHLVGVYVTFKGVVSHPSLAYARREKAIAGVIAYEQRVEDACEGAAAEVGAHFRTLCARLDVSGEFRTIQRGKMEEVAIVNSLHSDLLVIGHPEPTGLPDDMSAQRILLESGVPLLIIPNTWEGEAIGQKTMIGWNASPEARRAISNGMCLLTAAKSVTVLIVDPAACKRLGEETGSDIVQHLGRHGLRVDIEQVASRGRPVAEVILERAKHNGIDLLVVGARNPAHLMEIVLGHATKTLLTKMPVPVLVSS